MRKCGSRLDGAASMYRRFRKIGFIAAAGVGSFAVPEASAQVVGATAVLEVLQDNLATPTTVAVVNDLAFVPEGDLARLGVLGGLFRTRAVALDGTGLVGSSAVRVLHTGNDFFPEGVAADPVTQDLFVGSIFTGQIEQFSGGIRSRFLGRAPNATLQRGAVGMKVDNARGLLWVCDTNLGGNIAGGTLVGVSLDDASAIIRHELPDDSFCNDMVLDAAGNIFVAESFVGTVFRLDAANALTENSLEQFLQVAEIAPPEPGQFGANGVALMGDVLLVSNTFGGTLVRVDLTLDDPADGVSTVAIAEGDYPNAILSGPDGLLPISDTELLLVENGFAGNNLTRLVKLTFDLQ